MKNQNHNKKEYRLGANRMRRKIIREIEEWWDSDDQHINSLLRKIKNIKFFELNLK